MHLLASSRESRAAAEINEYRLTVSFSPGELRALRDACKHSVQYTAQEFAKLLAPFACTHETATFSPDGKIQCLTDKDQEYTPKCDECGERISLMIRKK